MLNSGYAKQFRRPPYGAGYVFEPAPAPGSSEIPRPQLFCGLTRIAAQVFWPDYDYKDAEKIANVPKSARRATGLRRPSDGRKRGETVHEQIEIAVNAGAEQLRASKRERTMRVAEQIHERLRDISVKAVCAEFVVASVVDKLASGIDIVGVHTARSGEQSLSLIEVKVGGENGMLWANGFMKSLGTHGIKNSQLNQAFVQLAFYRQMVADTYPGVRMGPCYVAQISTVENRVVFIPLEEKFIALGPRIRDGVLHKRRADLIEALSGRDGAKKRPAPVTPRADARKR